MRVFRDQPHQASHDNLTCGPGVRRDGIESRNHVQNPSIAAGISLRRPASRKRLHPGKYACVGWSMRQQGVGFDYLRYRQLLAEATDENKRLALIDLLIEERAMERLAAQRNSDRAAMTASTVARVLGRPRG